MSDSITGGSEFSENGTAGISDIFSEETMVNAGPGMHGEFSGIEMVLGLQCVSFVVRELPMFQIWKGK